MMKLAMGILVAGVVASAQGQQIIGIDFGDQNNQTGGNFNNITHLQNPLFNLVDMNGAGTGISLNVTDAFWPGSNTGGTGAPTGDAAGIPASATADNLFGSMVTFGGFLEPTGGVTFGGLDASGQTQYNFLIFASRMGVTDNREGVYSIDGANSGMATLNAANNTSNVALIDGIRANANGEITLSVTAGANNTSANRFWYLGYVQITVVPAPSSAALLGLGGLVATRRRRG